MITGFDKFGFFFGMDNDDNRSNKGESEMDKAINSYPQKRTAMNKYPRLTGLLKVFIIS